MNIELRPFKESDSSRVAILVGDAEVSKWTSNIPYPYTEQNARDWIAETSKDEEKHPFAVEAAGELVACVSYWPHDNGVEVGYWVGKDYWGKGICTTALGKMLSQPTFPRHLPTYAKVMQENIGSRRVLEKCGFQYRENGTVEKGDLNIDARFYVRD